jgi:hypothetical protein
VMRHSRNCGFHGRNPRDINEDTHVDLQDFGILSKCWQGTGTVPCLDCDLDYSGDVDLVDLQWFADAWLNGTF